MRVQWIYTEQIKITNIFQHSVWLQNTHTINDYSNHYLCIVIMIKQLNSGTTARVVFYTPRQFKIERTSVVVYR